VKERLERLFGEGFVVTQEGDHTFHVTAGMTGSVTLNTKDRWWNLGMNSLPTREPHLCGQPTSGFRGVGWLEAMTLAIKGAFENLGYKGAGT